jgi:quercetin dioxygenase-like cupin family protein
MNFPVSPRHSLTYDGAILNIFHANAGEGLPQHSHAYAHATCCHAGSVIIRKEGRSLTMTKDTQPVNLTAGEWHEIEALEDGTVFVNVFSEAKQGA